LQKDSSLQIEITTLNALPINVSTPELPYPQSSSDNHLYGDPEYTLDEYIQSWNSSGNPILRLPILHEAVGREFSSPEKTIP
jgi:hypothetical protein